MVFVPGTPAELAKPLAEQLIVRGELDGFTTASQAEQDRLIELEKIADDLHMLGRQYIVHSHRSLIIPKSFDADDPEVSCINFNNGVDFSGRLVTYSTVRVGKLLGGTSIRALCLTFENATLLPYFDRVDDSELLHTPVFAVADMDQVA